MIGPRSRRIVTALAVVVVLLALLGVAVARPGGGDSYSGGGGHGGGGGGGGGGDGDILVILELIFRLIELCYYYPQIGFPLVAVLVGWIIYESYKSKKNKDWDSGPPVQLRKTIDLQSIRSIDAEFSQLVFEDFAYRLFSAAHRARHSDEALVAAVGPYLDAEARHALVGRAPKGEHVEQVIVGAMRPFLVSVPRSQKDQRGNPLRIRVGLEFEANVITAKHTYYSVESWTFARDASAPSKPPRAAKTFPCPNCGAPWQSTSTTTQVCASCNQAVDNGRFDWIVETIHLSSNHERPPTLTTEVPERGTDLPTYKQNDVDNKLRRLVKDDPEAGAHALEARLELIYTELNKAWSQNKLDPVRGLVSDGLYDYLSYWVEAYKRQGLRNELVDMRITRTEVAKVMRDHHFRSVTFRIFGTGKDYVVRASDGKLVRGSKTRERAYSEYWTLIRSAQRIGPTKTDRTCGNCGAPLEVTMAGACKYCEAHVTSGEFDWVLSKIEQDDSYRG